MIQHQRRGRYAVGLAAVAMAAAACGGSSSGGNDTVTQGGAAAAVTTHSGSLGKYLTDDKGLTLYVFSKDTGTTSTCSGDCAVDWTAFTTSGDATATGAADASMLGKTTRSDGKTQVTYAGHPLYHFSGDNAAGDTNGEGSTAYGGTWTAVAPDGSAISSSSGSSSSSPTPAPYYSY